MALILAAARADGQAPLRGVTRRDSGGRAAVIRGILQGSLA